MTDTTPNLLHPQTQPPGVTAPATPKLFQARSASVLGALGGLGVLITLFAALLWLDSGGGQRWLVEQLATRTTQTGISLKIGRIEGSLYHKARLHDVELRDSRGAFLQAPQADLVWRPLSLLRKELIIDTLIIDNAQLSRAPVLRRPDKEDRLWPDMDLDIRSFVLKAMTLGGPAANTVHSSDPRAPQLEGPQLEGKGRILLTQSQADTRLAFKTLDDQNFLQLTLVADPAQDRFALNATLELNQQSPLARWLGLPHNLSLAADGQGTYQNWLGALSINLAGSPLAKLDLTLRQGTMNLVGIAKPNISLTPRWLQLAQALPNLSGQIDIGKRPAHIKIKAQGASAIMTVLAKYDRILARIPEGRITLADPRCLVTRAFSADIACAGLGLDGQISGPLHHLGYRLRLTAERLSIPLPTVGPTLGVLQSNRLNITLANRPNPIDTADITMTMANLSGLPPELAAYSQGLSLSTTLTPTRMHWEFAPLLLKSQRMTMLGSARLGKKDRAFDAFFKGGRLQLATPSLQGLPLVLDTRISWRPGQSTDIYFQALPLVQQWQGLKKTPAQNYPNLVDSVSATLRFGPTQISLDQIDVKTELGRFQGALKSINGKLEGALVGDVRALDKISPNLAYKKALPLRLNLSGTLRAPIITADTTIERYDIAGQSLRRIALNIRPLAERRFRATLSGQSDYGPLSLKTDLSFVQNTIRLEGVDAQLGRYLIAGNALKTNRWQGALTITLPSRARTASRARQRESLKAQINFDIQGARQRYVVNAAAQNLTLGWRDQNYKLARLAAKGQAIVETNNPAGFSWQWRGQLGIDGYRQNYKNQEIIAIEQLRLEGGIGSQKPPAAKAPPLQARLFISGQDPLPYQLQATLASFGTAKINRFTLTNLQGSINGAQVRALQPLQWVQRSAQSRPFWQLSQTLLRVGQGSAYLQGTWNFDGYQAQFGLRDIPSHLLFSPLNIPFQAPLSGQLSLRSRAAEGLVMLEANLTSDALSLRSRLADQQFSLAARYTKNDQIIGELMLASPKTSTRPFLERALTGNWRWSGPIQDLSAIIQLPDIQLAGQFTAGTLTTRGQIGGIFAKPELTGQIQLERGRWLAKEAEHSIEDIQITGRLAQQTIAFERVLATLPARARLQASGSLALLPEQGYPMRLEGQVNNLIFAQSPGAFFKKNGSFEYLSARGRARLSGNLALSDGRLRTNQSRVQAALEKSNTDILGFFASDTNLNLTIKTAEPLLVEAQNLNSRWSGTLSILGTIAKPRYAGNFQLEEGQLRFGRVRMRLTDGLASFDQSTDFVPTLNLRAQVNVKNGIAYAIFNGNKAKSSWQFQHSPSLGEEAVLARLLYDDLPRSVPALGQRNIEAALALAKNGTHGNSSGAKAGLYAPFMPFVLLQQIASTARPAK